MKSLVKNGKTRRTEESEICTVVKRLDLKGKSGSDNPFNW